MTPLAAIALIPPLVADPTSSFVFPDTYATIAPERMLLANAPALFALDLTSEPARTPSATTVSVPAPTETGKLATQSRHVGSQQRSFGPLFALLKQVEVALRDWDDENGEPPDRETLTIARTALALVAASLPAPRFGLGGSGDIYFSWTVANGAAFLTFEGNKYHLLLKQEGTESEYYDDLSFDEPTFFGEVVPRIFSFFPSLSRQTTPGNTGHRLSMPASNS